MPLGAALGQGEFAPPVPRIEDPSHARGYPNIRSPAAMRILLKQKVQEQNVCCAICARQNGARQLNRNFTKSESTLSTVPIPRNTFEPFVSADAVACYVGIERRQVMQLTRAGKLPAYPLDPEAKRKAWRYKLSEVDAMISGKS